MQSSGAARRALSIFGASLRVILHGLGWVFLALVIIAAAAGVYVHRRFSPENARLLAVEQLTALLRREVTIERMVLTPRGLKIRGLRVRRGRIGASDDLLTCDSALLTVKLRPLLHKRLEFDTVLLQSPQISLLRDAEGVWDLADVLGSSETRRGGVLPLALAAAETVVEEGVLRVDDRLNGRKAVFERLSVRVESFDAAKPFPVAVSFVSELSFATRTVTTSIEASGSVDLAGLNWQRATARADRLKALVNGLEVSGEASVVGFSPMSISADLSSAALGPDRWQRLAGIDSSLSLPATRWRVKAAIPAPGMLELEQLEAETPAGTLSATGMVDFAGPSSNLSMEVVGRDIVLEKASSWHPAWARHSLSGKGGLRVSLTGWPGRLQAREAGLSLRDFASTWGDKKLEDVDLDASATEEFSSVKAEVAKGKAFAFGAVFEDLSADFTLKKQNMAIERLVFLWSGSRVKLRARVEHISAPKEVVLSGTVDKLRWEDAQRLFNAIAASVSTRARTTEDDSRPWVRTFKYSIPRDFPDTVGRVRVGELTQANFWCKDLDMLWSLRGVTRSLDKATGEARLRFASGRVTDVATLQDSSKFLRVIFLPFVFMHKMNNLSVFSAATAYPKTLDINQLEGDYAVTKGEAETRYFHVDSEQLVAYAAGMADFAREKVDMSILTRLTSYRGTLPEWWVDEAGRPAIGFRVKGDMIKPELEPRFKKIGENEIERLVDEGRARAKKRFEPLEKIQTL